MNQHCYHEYCWDYSYCSVILYCYENIVFTMIVITQLEIVNDCLSIKGKWLSIISFFQLCHREGVMIFPPNVDDHGKEKYEGQWENGKMAGYGKVR